MSDEPPTGNQYPLWDANQVAAFMNVSRSWVYQRVESGKIPHVRVGGLVRFEPEAVKKFIRHDRVSATSVIARLAARGREGLNHGIRL